MAKIFYSLAGEGLGHATRVKTIVEDLVKDHEITIFAPEQAYALLEPVYRKSPVHIEKIPGLVFQYNQKRKLDYTKTILSSLRYLHQLPRLVHYLSTKIRREKPDLIITDFEPALPRAAQQCSVPYISFDHQNFLRHYNLSGLSAKMRFKAWFLALPIPWFYNRQHLAIISSFYFPPLVPSRLSVHQIGVLLQKEIASARPTQGGYLLAYFRRYVPEHVLAALRSLEMPVKIYGLGKQPASANLSFCAIDSQSFIQDLIHCNALISTAGNQLVGEAIYLQKPVLAMPEDGNFEQQINGYFLEQSKAGITVQMNDFSEGILQNFMSRLHEFQNNMLSRKNHGNLEALRVINAVLQTKALKHKISASAILKTEAI